MKKFLDTVLIRFHNPKDQEKYDQYQDRNIKKYLYIILCLNSVYHVMYLKTQSTSIYVTLFFVLLNIVELITLKFYDSKLGCLAKIMMITNFIQIIYATERNYLTLLKELADTSWCIKKDTTYILLIFSGFYFTNFTIIFTNTVTRWIFKLLSVLIIFEYLYFRTMSIY